MISIGTRPLYLLAPLAIIMPFAEVGSASADPCDNTNIDDGSSIPVCELIEQPPVPLSAGSSVALEYFCPGIPRNSYFWGQNQGFFSSFIVRPTCIAATEDPNTSGEEIDHQLVASFFNGCGGDVDGVVLMACSAIMPP
jgi:hypothetical protein